MKVNKNSYEAIIFDFDGVIMDTNHLKREAFKEVFQKYSNIDNEKIMKLLSPGRTRFEIFEEFIKYCSPKELSIQNVLKEYSDLSFNKLRAAKTTNFFFNNKSIENLNYFIVSAAFQEDLVKIIKNSILNGFVETKKVFGSPKTKYENIKSLYLNQTLKSRNILLIGDSESDWVVSNHFGYDFIFVSDWSSEKDMVLNKIKSKVPSIDKLDNLILI